MVICYSLIMNYRNHYDRLIERARDRVVDGYSERHHIVPRCMGGGDEPENLVRLTPEEHFVAHQLLVKIYPEKRTLVIAVLRMSHAEHYRGNKVFGWLRRKHAEVIGEVVGDYWRGRKRKPFSDEHRKKIAEAQAGKKRGPHSEEHKRRLSDAHRGKRLTAEHKQKLAKAKLGVKRGSYKPMECPHCGKSGSGGSMLRWHFDKCKVLNG